MDSAKVAVLLVSADFIASDFIARDELPPDRPIIELPEVEQESIFVKLSEDILTAIMGGAADLNQ